MNAKYHNSEKGQAIVFLVLGLVVFLGFVALALDGGMALADRRHSQNSADAASLAGGGEASLYLENQHMYYSNWNCSAGAVIGAMNLAEVTAVNRAAANNFSIDTNMADHNGTLATCGTFDYGFYVDKYIDVTVDISATTKSNFAQIIFPNALHNEVDAVTRIRPRQPLVLGNAIVALNPAACSGQQNGAGFHGNGDVGVIGGGIFSNGCLRNDGNTDVIVDDGGVYGQDIRDGDAFDPDAEYSDYQIPPSNYNVPLPDCSDPDAHNLSGDELLDPDITPQPLEPGLYCISGDLEMHSNDELHGFGVTIFLATGGIHVNGTADIQLSAPVRSPDPAPAIPGILIYLPSNNHSAIILNGNEGAFFNGTILAPGSSIQLTGTSQNTYQGQVVGWNVEVGGNSDTFVTFNPDDGYTIPTSIELYK